LIPVNSDVAPPDLLLYTQIMIYVTPAISIDEKAIKEEFIRSSGPGGQNVNKVSTAVRLRFDTLSSPSLPEPVRQRLKSLAGERMTEDGWLNIEARRFRTQKANRDDALKRLIELIRKAAIPPEIRHKTKPTYGSRLRRLDAKHHHTEIKKSRRPDISDA
jgi:ribosome-associated protein